MTAFQKSIIGFLIILLAIISYFLKFPYYGWILALGIIYFVVEVIDGH